MQSRKNPHLSVNKAVSNPSEQSRRINWRRTAVCLLAIGLLAAAAQPIQQGTAPADRGQILSPYLTTPPDANQRMRMSQDNAKQQSFEAVNAERKKQIADESAKLLILATELKSEVDKTTKDTLSISVIRKADAIEKLAHNVKEKMKLSVAAN